MGREWRIERSGFEKFKDRTRLQKFDQQTLTRYEIEERILRITKQMWVPDPEELPFKPFFDAGGFHDEPIQ